jgi:anti-sigma factor RsiW
MVCRDVVDRLSPFVDDELDPVASREVARHVETCPTCTAALARQRELGESVRHNLEYHRAPDLLRARLMHDLRGAEQRENLPVRRVALPWGWLGATAAAAAVVAVVAGTWMASSLSRGAEDAEVREAVSGHIRSLMANHLTDVASTDQHTVKPWFSGRVDFSPPVTDFAAQEYPLIGGRLDYMQGHPVAALVYMHRKHIINVFVWPQNGAADGIAPAVTQQGYHVIHATHGGMTFWVV